MIEITMEQAQAGLAGHLARAAQAGETIVITRDARPVAELRPLPEPPRAPRPIGLARGEFEVPPSFFEPLPDDLLDAFEGREG
jgi:antitoxin (DNA-binding transcriptional repressor) of toxin-antitoxin stability system